MYMTLHTLELRVDDENLWWAIQRRKLEYKERYGCKNWLDVLYRWANVPIESQLDEEDQARCNQLYQVMEKARSYNISPDSKLVKGCQNKAHDIITKDQAHQQALRDLITNRDQLIQLIDDKDLSPDRHNKCVDMLALLDSVIEREGQNK